MANKEYKPTIEQQKVLDNKSKFAIVSASAGTGKTATIVNYISNLIEKGYSINRMLIVTFTNNAASEMKERILENLMNKPCTEHILNSIDDILVSDVCTIHAYLKKLLTRNIEKFSLAENFSILDDLKGEQIRQRAYVNAFNIISKNKDFGNLIFSTRKEENLLKDVLYLLEKHFSVQANEEERLGYYKDNQQKIFDECQKVLNDDLIESFYKFYKQVDIELKNTPKDNKNYNYLTNFKQQLSKVVSENSFKENITEVYNMDFKRVVSSKDLTESFLTLKESVSNKIKECKKWDINQSEEWVKNPLILDIYNFYEIYKKELNEIKTAENLLDFNDLERYASLLIEDENILREIQDDFDFVFVDEYQDTNPVQEKLLKQIAKNSNFMAVGDPKQGIYGFRNATSQIMKDDIKNAESADGEVYYLKSNFRSNPKILDFVNDVFKNVMFEKSTGINYIKTSMLDGKAEFEEEDFPPVRIDLLNPVEEIEKKKEIDPLYNIFNDKLITDNDHKFEAEVIARRINELVLKKIFDTKTGSYRNVNYSDITILLRGRGGLVDRLIEVFDKYKIPVVSTIDQDIFESEEIDVLKNFLKLVIDYKDDVSLVSVLSSKLFGLSFERICRIKTSCLDKKNFYEAFLESEESKRFLKILNDFKLLCLTKGIKFAFEKLFDSTNYFTYLLSKPDGINRKILVEKFLNIIFESGFNFDIPSFLSYLETGSKKVLIVKSGINAVTLTTIHASKGLEYPIVILAGMGNDILKKSTNSKFAVNNEFGLGLIFLDYEKDIKCKNIVLTAINKLKKKKEFIDEIMLLYVAMTRAKNHLYIVGQGEPDNLKIEEPEDIFYARKYLDIILNNFNKENNNVELNIIDQIDEINTIKEKRILNSDKYLEKIKNYLEYNYKYLDSTVLQYKNSVTGINQENNEEKTNLNFGGSQNLDLGNAYHKALEILNFDLINDVADIEKFLPANLENKELINNELLYKDIILIKEKINGLKVFKEKQFTLKINAKNIDEKKPDEEILVQGIVDLFAIGEKNVLIDYKYTNIKEDNVIINKYKKQLYLYQTAIEEAFKLKINEIYLLSLKYGKLIKIN